jgi:general secretion pathway protein G
MELTMPFCAWCGNQVTEVSYAQCTRCGNPTNGSQRVAGGSDGSKGVGIIVGILVGGLALVAIIGILAAIAIPNMLTALNRSRQKRTIADMRAVAAPLEAFATDKNDLYPDGNTVSSFAPNLVPEYAKTLPTVDAWGTPLRYECWPAGACQHYAIGSAGADKTWEHDSLQEYAPNTETQQFNSDIVFSGGTFLQYPEGVQH